MTGRIKTDMKVAELVDAFKNEPMQFAPGTRYSYNNSAYVLLGALVEKVSGQSYGAFVTEHIFKPLGMTSSFYGSNEPVIPKRVQGYTRDGDTVRNAQYLSMTQPYSAGSLLSSVDDLARWDAALSTEKLLKRASLDRMWTSYVLADGKPTGYGYGWSIEQVEGASGRAPRRRHSRVLDLRPAPAATTASTWPCSATATARSRARATWRADSPQSRSATPSPSAWRRPSTRRCSPGTPASTRSTRTSSRTVTVENGKLYTQRSGGQPARGEGELGDRVLLREQPDATSPSSATRADGRSRC